MADALYMLFEVSSQSRPFTTCYIERWAAGARDRCEQRTDKTPILNLTVGTKIEEIPVKHFRVGCQ